jgi:hypothetical protein
MDKSAHNFLRYWRNTLADSARDVVDLARVFHIKNCEVNMNDGSFPLVQALKLIDKVEIEINKQKGIEDPKDPDWQKIFEIRILISLFSVYPRPEYTLHTGEEGAFYPFWINANLNRKGNLSIPEDSFPYIPRVYLEPQVNEKVNFIFSGVDKVDDVFTKTFNGENWPAYWKYTQSTFSELTGQAISTYTVENYETRREAIIAVHNKLAGAADGIIKLYDYLTLGEAQLPTLVKKLCEREFTTLQPLLTVEEYEDASLTHLGQMGHEHSLSFSQRRSLYHFYASRNSEITAVNGPPGTGKTTLLQSIVSNEVVHSAIEGREPRIILACSTNNQAVTNIIDSFGSVKGRSGALYERWISEILSFALYLPGFDREVKEGVHYFKGLKDHSYVHLETWEYIEKAKNVYRKKFTDFYNQDFSIEESAQFIQQKLISNNLVLEAGIKRWKKYKTITILLDNLGADSNKVFPYFLLDTSALLTIENAMVELEAKVSNYLDGEPFWIKLFSWLPAVKEKRATRLKQIFRNCPVNYDSINFYHIKSVHSFFDKGFSLIKEIKANSTNWENWKITNAIHGNPPLNETQIKGGTSPFFYNELEQGIKNDMFYLAIHYWEARWILEVEKALQLDLINKNSKENAMARWRRYAMLTPCFVSTFYMAPKRFTYSKAIKKKGKADTWESPPLLESIDLLIVDEAGQVSPEIGAATFGLAKRAIVVGDTKQIEPVWNVPRKVDYANLHKHNLIAHKDDENAINELNDRGFLGSSGSIMRLAQKSSCFQINKRLERGMYLTEHRRCFDEIINYCNQLAYGGILEPLKGSSTNALFTPLQFISVEGDSISYNASRMNKTEADAIAIWVRENKNFILDHYQSKENQNAKSGNRKPIKLVLGDVLAVLTPFTSQKQILKSTLKKYEIDTNRLIIGTVHALQGAERPIIIFSSVYGRNNIGMSYFFDRNPSILNVAVSRAKDSFILFGNGDVFSKNRDTPSALLYNHIKAVSNKLDLVK